MDLRDYAAALRRRKWTILLTTLTVLGSAVLFSLLQTPVYAAKARLLIERDSSVFGSNQSQASLDPAFVETQMEVIRGQAVRALVRERLRVAPPVTTALVGTTAVVEIRAESVRPRDAAAIANAYVDAYLAYRRNLANEATTAASQELQAKIADLQQQIDALGSQLNSLPPCPTGSCPQRDSLQRDRDALVAQQVPFKEKIDQLQVDAKLGTAGAQIVAPATEPTDPVRPQPVRNAALALGLGLAVGVGLALLFETLDDSIKGKDELERATGGLPVMGMIPTVPGWKDRTVPRVVTLTEPSSPSAEAYRTLRTSIRFLTVDRRLRIIQITSPSASEGKTTTTANLAVALARAGERVVIVSCDLRRPRLHEFFGVSNQVGFTSVLLGEAPLASALKRV
ncbi:MAG TPA: Wzz/FepE/Etk N-terminal domain-containing protein, partial [Acidimicrobiales bacterium]|nr:Wzz/FepE/Etk N-terminal domain-containing protein [Acidimicrobiales bacterium]